MLSYALIYVFQIATSLIELPNSIDDAVHIRFLHFLLAYYISAFKSVKGKT